MGVALEFLLRTLSCLAGESCGTTWEVEPRGTRGKGGWSPERGHADNQVLGFTPVVMFSFSRRELEGGLAQGREKTKPKTFLKLVLGHVCVFIRLNMMVHFGPVMFIIIAIWMD